MRETYARALFLAIAMLIALAGVASAAPRICVIVPHFKDEYWLSVGYGLEEAALTAGAELMIYESGGYHSIGRQIELIEVCARTGAAAILIGAVSSSDPQLVSAIEATSGRVPVLALVNELEAPGLSASIGVDWRTMGAAVGGYLARRAATEGQKLLAVLVTGPGESGWGPILDEGLAEGLAGSDVEIVATYRADTGLREQLREVERAFSEHPDMDVLIGSAPAIEGAMALVRRLPSDAPKPELVATYISHSVLRGVKSGMVKMVPFDDPIAQGRLGVELALQAAEGRTFPGLSGPDIIVVETGTEDVDRIRLSPSGFFPRLQ